MRKSLSCGCVVLALVGCVSLVPDASADTVSTISDPGGTTTDIGARIRWGASGFEASIFDNNPFGQTPTLNPSGSPVWALNTAYGFLIDYDFTTGLLALSVDFNNNDTFEASESISRSAFTAPSQASYAGYGFNYLSITGNEGGSTARSTVSNLNINGTSLPTLAPGGLFLEQFYGNSSGIFTDITITGDLTFTTPGTAQERPSWNFNFKNPQQPIPEPATMAMLGLGIGGLVMRRARRRA